MLSLSLISLLPRDALGALPDLLEPAARSAASPEDAAVVIGLERYGFLPAVPHAARDAEAVRTWLVSTRGLPAERVILRTDGNREQLLAAIDEAAARVGPHGHLWLWFSGHGATSPDDGSLLLVGDDAKPQQAAFASRSVSLAELEQRIAVPTLLVFDACTTGQGRLGEALIPGARFALPASLATESPITVWTAASAGEIAEPWPDARHGAFTYLALGALRGWADGQLDGAADGQVTLPEAQAWVQRALAALGAGQHPQLHGTFDPIAEAREQGPALADLPPLRPARAPDPEGDPIPIPPIHHTGSGIFEDGAGTAYDRRALVGVLRDEPDVQRIARREDRSLGIAAAGGALAGLGAAGALASALYHPLAQAQYEAKLLLAESCLTTTGACPTRSTPRAPAPLWVKEAVWGGVSGLGTSVVVAGVLGHHRNQRRLAEAATEALGP